MDPSTSTSRCPTCSRNAPHGLYKQSPSQEPDIDIITGPCRIVTAHPHFKKHGNYLTATTMPTGPSDPTYSTLSFTAITTSDSENSTEHFAGSLGIAKNTKLTAGTAVVQVAASKDKIVKFHTTLITLENSGESVYVISTVDVDEVHQTSLWLTANPTTGALTLEKRQDGPSQYWTFDKA
ncbi:hypothetical protein PHLGIDRAFT_222064 [Phlebiopsis gigantea 11061_1 CR5-6]|uniref:Uncharacterized protein n=1 Tax=Phlebiopsis gigantea (strain 11061_1 CR5-6) TaxID=745531 RepID=A0A0C3S2J4_PHLG1|nr:hypothetical protein PHLGIDRAFT_222064 [Phlebiopsis gigantea 11061_1 CR5-6]